MTGLEGVADLAVVDWWLAPRRHCVEGLNSRHLLRPRVFLGSRPHGPPANRTVTTLCEDLRLSSVRQISLTLVSFSDASLVWFSASQQSRQTRMVRVLIHGSLD